MKISDLLNEDTVLTDLDANNKIDAIKQLVNTISGELEPEQLKKASTAVLEREQIMSTGVGKGLAIPHGKCAGLERSYAAFARMKNPIEFGAIDDEPVSMMFLLIGPDFQNSLHIKMLSRVSRIMNNADFRAQLMACKNKEEIQQAFSIEEEKFVRV